MDLDRKIKTALDETRLMILGSQVLFGFFCEAVFQDGFANLSDRARVLVCSALVFMTLSIGCLIAPSMQHRIVEAGESSRRLERATTLFAAWGLFPMALGLGIALFATCERIFGPGTAMTLGVLTTLIAGFFWYVLAFIVGFEESAVAEKKPTPLATKVEQMLTEARVVIPGCQAMLGFQFMVVLTHAFDELPMSAKIVHIVSASIVAARSPVTTTDHLACYVPRGLTRRVGGAEAGSSGQGCRG